MNMLRMTAPPISAWRLAALFALLVAALMFTPPPPILEANSPPKTPASVTLTRADGTVTASGYAVSNATKYHITYTVDGGKSWHAPVEGHTNITTRSLTFKADNAKTYIVGVRAGNADGWSGWRNSPVIGPYTPPKPKPTPTPAPDPTLTATRSNDGSAASVFWTKYAGRDFQYYRVIVCDDSQYDGSSCSGTVFKSDAIYDAGSTGPITVTGLSAQTGYGVILQVWRGGSALKIHATLPAVPVVGPNVPDAPANLTVTPGDGYLDIAWDAVTDATGYDVRAKKAGSSSWHDVASNISTTSHRYTTTETIDYVAVRARNANGAGNWTELWRGPAHDWLTTVQQTGGASAQSAQGQNKLAAPATITVTRDNWIRDEKLHVSWAAVSGASGYNLACSDSDGWSWWNCGSTTSATSLTVDNHPLGDLASDRSYLVAVRAVTGNAADASDWKRSEDVRPAFGHLFGLTHSRSSGSITLSWKPNLWTTGYQVDCAVQGQTYTRCATLSGQDDSAATHTVTLTSWTAGGTDYAIDNGAAYNISITSTNQWGSSGFSMDAPLIAAFSNVSNLSAASDTYGHTVSSALDTAAVGFTTGSNAGGYTLRGVTITFLTPTHGRTYDDDISVAIRAASGGDPATSDTHTLSLVHGNPKTGGNVTYSCSGTCSLSANATYFLVLTTSSSAEYIWDTTVSAAQTNSTNFGWTIADALKQFIGGSWSDRTYTGKFRVSAAPNPSLTSSNVAQTTATLTITNHTDAWYYKATTSPHTTCQGPVAAGTSSKDLTGLTAGADYTYSAYSDSGCTTANRLATAARFTTLSSVSNLSETSDGSGISIASSLSAATGFTTGSNSGGYTLANATVKIRSVGGDAAGFNVDIHAASGGNPASSRLHALNGSAPTGAGQYTFTCSGGCSLDANTTYFLVMEATRDYIWDTTASAAQTNAPSAFGWSIADAGKEKRGGNWSNVSGWTGIFKASATPNPSLDASNIASTTATLTMSHHGGGDWYYKHTNTGATCDGPVSGTSKDLTGLTANTSYTYSAYSDSGCTSGNLLATAAQFTTTVTTASVSNLSETLGGLLTALAPNAAYAQEFTTGNTTGIYKLSSLKMHFSAVVTASAVTVAIHDKQSNGTPSSTARIALTGTPASGETEFTCSSNCELDANTSYFVKVSASSAAAAYPSYTTSDAQTLTPTGTGWSIADAARDEPNSWSELSNSGAMRISVTATVHPKLTASSIGTTTATLTIANHGGVAWYYKHTNTGATCEGPVAAGTSTKALTGLTAGTSYTFSAYSDSGCTTGNLLATASQFTTAVSVSNLSQTTNSRSYVGNGGISYAIQFRTGGNTGGYTLSSVTVDIHNKNNNPGPLQVQLWSDSSGSPGSHVSAATLSGNDPPANGGQATYTCSGNCAVTANTNYWIRLSASGGTGHYWSWNYTSSGSETLEPSGNGWQIGDGKLNSSGNLWIPVSGYYKVKVTALPR